MINVYDFPPSVRHIARELRRKEGSRPMSYSFTITAKSREEAKEKVKEQLDRVARDQPSHIADKDAALGAASAFVDLVTIPEGRDVRVSVSGSLGWQHDTPKNEAGQPETFNGAGVNVSASLA